MLPFMLDTFNFVALKIDDLLKRIQKVICNNVMSSRSINIVFK